MVTALINKIIPFSNVDGKGNRMAIFFQGCSFNCVYCHNPETIRTCNSCGKCVPTCPSGALSKLNGNVEWFPDSCTECDKCLKICPYLSSPRVGKMTVADIMKEIEPLNNFIRGITVSGGECMLQADFLCDLFQKVRKKNLSTYIDSNGSVPFSSFPDLLILTDAVMLDLKAFDNECHQRITGKSNHIVLENIRFLASKGKLLEVRTVILPDFIDSPKNITETSRFLSSIDPAIPLKLIAYRPFGVDDSKFSSSIPDDQFMSSLKIIAESEGLNNVLI